MVEFKIPEEYRFAPGILVEGEDIQDNPRMSMRQARALSKAWRARGKRVPPRIAAAARGGRRRRRSRRARRVRAAPRRRRRSRRAGPRRYRTRTNRRRRARSNPRFGRHRPTLYYTGRGWRAGRRSRLGIKGHRVNRRRRRGGGRRRYRRNPVGGGGGGKWYSLPKKSDFGAGWKGKGAAALGIIGGLAIPGLTGYAYNLAFDKYLRDSVSKAVGDGNVSYVKTASRLGIKAGVGALAAYATAKLTRKPAMGRMVMLGTIIGLILDGIASIASYTIGSSNPFGKAIIMRGIQTKPTLQGVALNAFGLGEVAGAYAAIRDGNLAKSGVRVMQHPTGLMGLYSPTKGIIMTGKPEKVLGRYHAIMGARFAGLGEMITVEAGYPWRMGKGADTD